MTIELIREVMLWCTIINFGVLILWTLGFILLHDFIYRLHGKLFRLSEEQFNGIHYAGMAIFKMAIFILNLVPLIALNIAG